MSKFRGASSTHYGGRKAMALRQHWAAALAAGPLPCWRCGRVLTVDSAWTVGHIVARAEGGPDEISNTWPECARCNFRAGAQLGAQRRNAQRPAVVSRLEAERDRGIRGI